MKTSKRITPEMIKKYFGVDAKIERRLGGVFLVRTATGGEIEITRDRIRPHLGGEDVYRAMTLLASEAWGGLKASGPREHILACMAHGEALGVMVTPVTKQPGAGCARLWVAFMLALIGLPVSWFASFIWGETGKSAGLGGTVIAVVLIWGVMAKAQKEAERRQAQELRFIYPVHHGTPRDASREDLEDGGWL